MDNEQIARRFNRMAALMEIRGEDQFRLRSYRMAAEAIETWPTEMREIVSEPGPGGLQEIPGVGKAASIGQLNDAGGDHIEEIAVVRNENHRAREIMEEIFQPENGFGVEMVGGFVEEQ